MLWRVEFCTDSEDCVAAVYTNQGDLAQPCLLYSYIAGLSQTPFFNTFVRIDVKVPGY